MIKTYRKKPAEVQAVEWTGYNLDEIKELAGEEAHVYSGCLFLSNSVMCNRGDMIIKDSSGKVYSQEMRVFNMISLIICSSGTAVQS